MHAKFDCMDANFHMIKLIKNCDPDDRAYWDGRGYFTSQKELQEYLAKHNQLTAEVSSV